MGKTRGRRHFDRDFKTEAARKVSEKGLKLSEVASDLGIHPNMLSRWKKEYLSDQSYASPSIGHTKYHKEELRRLRREVSHLREERDILKKAVAILTKQGKKNLSL